MIVNCKEWYTRRLISRAYKDQTKAAIFILAKVARKEFESVHVEEDRIIVTFWFDPNKIAR